MAYAIWRIESVRRFDQPNTASTTKKPAHARTKLRKYGEHTAKKDNPPPAAASELCGRLGATIEAADTMQACGIGCFCVCKIRCRGPPLLI